MFARRFNRKYRVDIQTRISDIVERKASSRGEDLGDYIIAHISKNAKEPNELIAELFSKASGSEPKEALAILKEARIL